MKKIVYFTLTVLFTALIIQSCNTTVNSTDESNTSKKSHRNSNDTTTNGLVIAYYVQDSIQTAFNYYRQIDSILKAKNQTFERQLRGKYENYYEYENLIRQRMESGEIDGYQYDGIQQEVMQKQEAIANFERQRGAELQNESMRYQRALMNKISEAGREFSEQNGLDMLFFYAKGGQITYISDAFDVTEDFMAFLNKREDEIMTGVEEEVEEKETIETSKGLNLNP